MSNGSSSNKKKRDRQGANGSIPTEPGAARGDRGEQVEKLQSYLRRFGYLRATEEEAGGFAALAAGSRAPVATVGVFDDSTVAGLRRFQAFVGLPVTGELDEATIAQMSRRRCGFPDLPLPGGNGNGAGDGAGLASFVAQGSRWNRTNLTYGYQEFSGDLTQAQIRTALASAFTLWSQATPLRFTEIPVANGPDIVVRFVAGDHGDGNTFDGAGSVLAHAYYPPPGGGAFAGDAHFDDAETWTVALPVPAGGTDLVTVAAHEIGHSLGLAHSTEAGALMYPYYGGPHRHLGADDVLGIQTIYGTRVREVPGWFGAEDQGADIATADISGNGRPDLVVFHLDNPGGENHGYYRVGWNLNRHGNVTDGWSQIFPVPGWFGAENQGAGIAIADISGNGRPDLVVFHIDNPGGENYGYYRIGWNLNTAGQVTGGWSQIFPVPGWFGAEDQGAAIALADVSGNGRPDLLVFHLDNPQGDNHGYYRIGWNLSTGGAVSNGWSAIRSVPGWFGWENQGAGVALADLNGNGRPDLLVFHLDNPGGDNHGHYRIGWNLTTSGIPASWSGITPVPGWFGWENQGAGIATADLNGNGLQDLLVFHVDNPGGENHGYYRVIGDL